MIEEEHSSFAGGDAPGGNTRTHPEHDGEAPDGRWYCTGDGVGEQVAASYKKEMKEPDWKQAEAFEINFNIDTDMKKGDFMTTRPAGKCC